MTARARGNTPVDAHLAVLELLSREVVMAVLARTLDATMVRQLAVVGD
jgi:hypothetical protein